MKKIFALIVLSLSLSACATHQVRFQPWKGIPAADLKDVQAGVFSVPKDKLFDAAAATLEHEPYLHWTFDSLDKGNGLIVGAAGLFREIQVRVTDAENGKSRMAISVPRRVLKAQAKIYIQADDSGHMTAYEPAAKDLPRYTVQAANAQLEPEYFYSFTYRVLNDRTQVPFVLESYEDQATQGWAPAQESAPTPAVAAPVDKSAAPAPAATPVPTGEGSLPPAHGE